MKKLYLIFLLALINLLAFGQTSSVSYPDVSIPYYVESRNLVVPFQNPSNNTVRAAVEFDETVIGTTYWDLQSSNSAPPNRAWRYEDGSIAGVWMMGNDTENDYLDRGTGYAFYNGTSWSTQPTERVETERTGWPSYAPVGSGEIIAAHHNSQGIVINYRETVGSGEWTEYLLPNPDTSVVLSWPRLVTAGADRMTVHMLVSTYMPYNDMDRAILYYRSMDGGVTWETQARVLEGMSSSEYNSLMTETYAWAEPKDSTLAFVVADRWSDLFIMKSSDNGDTWEKTVVWQHPYPMWNGTATDTFYSPDGAASIALDNSGSAHVAFGISRTFQWEGSPSYSWFPFVDGLAYWNESMNSWTDGGMETLNPDNLASTGNLVGWIQDLDDNGEIDLIGNNYSNLGIYYTGLTSMPQLLIDDENRIFLVYSGVAEGFDNGSQMYRHLFIRTSLDGGNTWGSIMDLTGETSQAMNESVFPAFVYGADDDNLYIIYQSDTEPGMSVFGDMDDPTVNSVIYLTIPKALLVNSKNVPSSSFSISQNYPNPFSDNTSFRISLEKQGVVSLKIFDITGRMVMQLPEKSYLAGEHIINLNGGRLSEGMYTYTFIIEGQTISNKMVVNR